ncbi:MAG: SDR family NAD(P)-dependent oxidoreductase [Acidimicrobiales bacterium]
MDALPPPLPTPRRVLAQAVDTALEGTIALSFSRLGYEWRDRLFRWSDLTERPMFGRVAVVTGATSGLGLAAATRLASLGASVRVVGRDIGRTEQARELIVAQTGNDDVEIGVADLARLDDVRRCASQIAAHHDRLDVLINNAGALVHQHELTDDGIELTAQTHVVAPFLLTHELLGLLGRTPGSRVVTVSSGGLNTQRLDLERLDRESTRGPHPDFDGVKAYALAKRAQVVLNGEWAARAADRGVTFHAMHPGWVDTPGVQASLPDFARVMGPWLRTPFQGADTMVWLATAREPLERNGRFWLDRHQRWPSKLPWTRTSPEQAEHLWRWVAERAAIGAVDGPSPVSAT